MSVGHLNVCMDERRSVKNKVTGESREEPTDLHRVLPDT